MSRSVEDKYPTASYDVTQMYREMSCKTEGPEGIEKEGLCSITRGGGLPPDVMFDASRPIVLLMF